MPSASVMRPEQQQLRFGSSVPCATSAPRRLEEYLKTYKKCLVLVSHSQARRPARASPLKRAWHALRPACCTSELPRATYAAPSAPA